MIAEHMLSYVSTKTSSFWYYDSFWRCLIQIENKLRYNTGFISRLTVCAWRNENMASLQWFIIGFNRLAQVCSICFQVREIRPQSGDFSRHKVAAYSDTSRVPPSMCFIIYRASLAASWMSGTLTTGKSMLTLRIPSRLGHFLKQLKHPSHNLFVPVLQDQYCVQGREERQGPTRKGRQHLLVYRDCLRLVKNSDWWHSGSGWRVQLPRHSDSWPGSGCPAELRALCD